MEKYHKGQKTLWDKEKLLVPSNFSFSHIVFHSYKSLVCQNAALCGNGLNYTSHTSTDFVPGLMKSAKLQHHSKTGWLYKGHDKIQTGIDHKFHLKKKNNLWLKVTK